jgi:hypothetical protein
MDQGSAPAEKIRLSHFRVDDSTFVQYLTPTQGALSNHFASRLRVGAAALLP